MSRSRFIGRCFPVAEEADALSALERIGKETWDARHHCYAYRIGGTASIARYSDDGEPAGTAGLPMMHVLQKLELTHVLCVVTRYFGGVLLGTGGLMRAYTKACRDAVEAAGMCMVTPCSWYRVTVSYPLWNALRPFLSERCLLDDVAYTDAVSCTMHVKCEDREDFLSALRQRSDARADAMWLKDGYASFPITEVMR